MARKAQASLHRAKPFSIKLMLLAAAMAVAAFMAPLFGLPLWSLVTGILLATTLIYWVLNNPVEEFLAIKEGKLYYLPVREHLPQSLALADLADVRPASRDELLELEIICRSGEHLAFQAYYEAANDSEREALEDFLRHHIHAG
ncbi:hypothetical protein [Gallaecimonas sp. GXIMD4217]|uniref:hypothetical protein n=1 Tax=Gallaecimonas sp. GXIMD4217 TaxID=3131927 RepID=UPI00311ACED1